MLIKDNQQSPDNQQKINQQQIFKPIHYLQKRDCNCL